MTNTNAPTLQNLRPEFKGLNIQQDKEACLFPCPFCGGSAIESTLDKEYNFVMCEGCGACISNRDSLPELDCVKAWNRRVKEVLK